MYVDSSTLYYILTRYIYNIYIKRELIIALERKKAASKRISPSFHDLIFDICSTFFFCVFR